MEKKCFAFIGAFILFEASAVMGQSNAPGDMYTDYNKYLNDAWKGIRSGPHGPMNKTIKEIREKAALLMEEDSPAKNVRAVSGRSKVLNDEDIFSQRENSVFILGKFYSCGNCTSVQFDLIGTAFAIAEDGVCVTNYHVLKDIIRPTEKDIDSVYFIMTADRKIRFIDGILAYSQNNDIVVFKVNTQGDKLSPIPLGKPARVGAPVFCISHPIGYFYYFSKGIVSRNVSIDSLQAAAGYSKNGSRPIRMEITADYGVGSSGGPILDKYGNLVGIVSSTTTLYGSQKDKDGNYAPQLVIKDTSPVKALADLLRKQIIN